MHQLILKQSLEEKGMLLVIGNAPFFYCVNLKIRIALGIAFPLHIRVLERLPELGNLSEVTLVKAIRRTRILVYIERL